MVDVDPNLRGTNRGQSGAEPILNCGVERDRNIDIFRFGRRFGEQICVREKTVFLKHAFFVPNANVFAEFFEGKAERELAPESVAIRANMTKNRKLLIFERSLADLREHGRVAQGVVRGAREL